MSHETENPLIIDVVGEVEPVEEPSSRTTKKTARPAAKKGFFRKEKAASETTATQAASEAEVNAAKRAATAVAVPPVQGPVSQKRPDQVNVTRSDESERSSTAQDESAPSTAQAQAQTQPELAQTAPDSSGGETSTQPVESAVSALQPEIQEKVSSQPQTQAASQPFVQPQPQAHAQAQPQAQVQAQPVDVAAPQPSPAVVPSSQPASAQSAPPVSSQPVQSVVQTTAAAPVQQASSAARSPQPAANAFVGVPMNFPAPQPAVIAPSASPQRSRAFYVFGILAAAVAVFAACAIGFFAFSQDGDQDALIPTSQADLESGEVKPIVSASLDQASKVSLRATAEGWTEDASTPAIAYIKRVDDASAASSTKEGPTERYFAFAPNKSASISLPAGRYAISFIAPMNSDGSLYAIPDMVDMIVGDGGMAVLPVDFRLVPKAEVTQDQALRALAQLRTASEKGDTSFDHEPFKKSIDLALTTWFLQDGPTTEQPATDLTQEQQKELDAQVDTQSSTPQGSSASTSNQTVTTHTHQWLAQHEMRWRSAIVPVIDAVAWESPVYARYRCQEGILFETFEECVAHVRERGNEPYTESNEIIRIDYHPAVVHYEEQGSYEDVITGYRCSVCGARATLQ